MSPTQYGWATLAIAFLAGCGESVAPFDGVHDFELRFDVGQTVRSAVVHVPPSYDGSRAVPLVLAFHGAGMTGAQMQDFSGLDDPADRLGFVVVYPNGAPDWEAAEADDLPFARALIERLGDRLRIGRTYATGFSRGGFFTMRLACEESRRFAAVGIVAATMPADLAATCDPATRIPTLLMVGTLDLLVPIDGDSASGRLSADSTIRLFARRNGCNLQTPSVGYLPDTAADNRRIRFERYLDCGAETILYVVEGGNHTWFGGDADAGWLIGAFFLSGGR